MSSILIVEDNSSFRQLLATFLNEHFSHVLVTEAEDARSALENVKALRPDVLFVDIHLPGENGLELTKKIKTLYCPVIIILTNMDLAEYRCAAFRCGADYFFTKDNIRRNELLALVESIVSSPASGLNEITSKTLFY